MDPIAEGIFRHLYNTEKQAELARQAQKATGYLYTDSNADIPADWIVLTRKNLIPGETVRRSYVGPLVKEMDTVIAIEVNHEKAWFAKTAWTVTKPVTEWPVWL